MVVENRRKDDALIEVIASRLDVMHMDMSDMKEGMKTLAEAVVKLAVVEERQAQASQAQERAFKALERVEQRITDNERNCRALEKGLQEKIEAGDSALSKRVADLEKDEPLQKQTSSWVLAAVWGTLGVIGLYLGPRILERILP